MCKDWNAARIFIRRIASAQGIFYAAHSTDRLNRYNGQRLRCGFLYSLFKQVIRKMRPRNDGIGIFLSISL